MSTIAHFLWNDGVDYDWMLSVLRERYKPPAFKLGEAHASGMYRLAYNTPEGILRCSVFLPITDFNFNLANCQRLGWLYRKADSDQRYFSFTFYREERDGGVWDSVRNGKLVRLVLAFDPDINPWVLARGDNAKHLDLAIEKYHEMKALYELLGCDSVHGYSDSYGESYSNIFDDPGFDYKLFRFAKTGRQIILPPLEERRAMREGEGCAQWRLVIDRSLGDR